VGERAADRGVPLTTPGEGVGLVVAQSASMRELLEIVERLASVTSPVLLEGESGTGKDLVAHLLHYRGTRRANALIKVHCPSIPEDLMESDLLGHERGAFTDAKTAKLGKIEMAGGGTLYFDQIQDLSPRLQAKLLRVVESKRFERLGGTRTIEVDVRFVASSNVPLRDAVSRGLFREDLFHRLGVVPLGLPPLRERREDVLPLAELFLGRARERGLTAAQGFSPEAAQILRGYRWPGNVRELRAAVERSALFSGPGAEIPSSALPEGVTDSPHTHWEGRERQPSLRDVEKEYIRHVLGRVGGNQTRAAAVLGISRKALWQKRRRYGLA
jgi:DNA-binding NtrC family response regulator